MTLVVLSAGIVFIYRSFFLCADYLTRINQRLDAHQMLEEKINQAKQYAKEYGNLLFTRSGTLTSPSARSKHVEFFYQMEVVPVAGFDHLFILDVALTWQDKGMARRMHRQAMLELG